MNVKHEEFKKHWSRDRYLQVEADGHRAGYMSWTQRPSAERNSLNRGLGVYDRREGKVILEPDPVQRFVILTEAIEKCDREAAEALATMESIEEAMAE